MYHRDAGVASAGLRDLRGQSVVSSGGMHPILQYILVARDAFSGLCSDSDCLFLG
jgi:hypothetical protein